MHEEKSSTEDSIQWVRDEGLVLLPQYYDQTCGFQTYPGSYAHYQPPEYCENDVIPGQEFCADHTGPDEWDDAVEPDFDDEPDEPCYGPFTACYEADMDAA